MDGSAPHIETLRPAGSTSDAPPEVAQPATALPVRPEPAAVAGQGEFMASHDRLASALVHFEAAKPGFRGVERFDLNVAARLCGWSGQGDVLAWSRARVLAYRSVMAGAVRDMLAAISLTNSLPRAVGEAA